MVISSLKKGQEVMMKVNQVLLSFLLVLGLTNITLQAGQATRAIKGAGKGFATAARIATNRASKQEEQIFMIVNAGTFLLEFIQDLAKATKPKPAAERDFMETLSLTITGAPSLTQAFIDTGKGNLDFLCNWYKNKKKTQMENAKNEDGTLMYTAEEIEKNMATFDKATGPVIRLLKGESKIYERIAINISLGVVKFINTIRNTFTKGRKLNTSEAIVGEAATSFGNLVRVCSAAACSYVAKKTVEVSGKIINILVDRSGKIVDAAGNIIDQLYNIQGNLVDVYVDTQGKIIDASGKIVTLALNGRDQLVDATNKVINVIYDQSGKLTTRVSETFGAAADFIGITPETRAAALEKISNVISFISDGANFLYQKTLGSEDKFYDASELLINLRLLLDDPDLTEHLEESTNEEYTEAVESILYALVDTLEKKGTSLKTIELLFENLKNEIDSSIMRKIDLKDFPLLPTELQKKIIESWQTADSTDLIETLVDLQEHSNIDKVLVETICKNNEWKNVAPEKLIQIPDSLYNLLSVTVLTQIQEALKVAPKDFDIINKLTILSLTTDDAWKKATAQDLIDFPAELYSKISATHLQQIETLVQLADQKLSPEDALNNNPYADKLTMLEAIKLGQKPISDSKQIQQQVTTAQKQQADQVAQHTTTTPAQTVPDKTTPIEDPSLPNFDDIPSRARSDSTSSTTSTYHDAQETAEEIAAQEKKAQQEKEMLEKAAHEKAIETPQVEHAAPEHGL
jgi:hypothetical protein